MIVKIVRIIKKELAHSEILLLSLITFLFSLLRLPSVVEPYWYGDEGIYQVIGIAINQGRILYREIWDNKPPMLYLIYALYNGDQFFIRLLSLAFGALSVIAFYFLAKKIYKSKLASYISTTLFAIFFGIPLIEGNIANAENFMLLPTILAFYLVFAAKEKIKFFPTFIAGIFLSISFLTKIVAVFDLAAVFTIIFISRFPENLNLNKNSLKNQFKKIINGLEQETILIIGFVVPIFLTVLYFLFVEALPDFYHAVFSQNVGYVGYGNYFLFPMGFLFLKLVIVLFSIFLIARYRKYLAKGLVLISIWLVFSMFNVFFSQRPYTHYLIILLPSLSLFAGYIIDNKKYMRITIPAFLIILAIIFSTFKLNFKKVGPYYANYLSFVFGNMPTEEYQSFFDKNTPRDYGIANFIKLKARDDDEVFIWGDNGQVYALSGKLPPGRYIVSYHVTFYKDAIEETKAAIESKKPKYIIQTKNTKDINNFLTNYELKYTLDRTKIYERQP